MPFGFFAAFLFLSKELGCLTGPNQDVEDVPDTLGMSFHGLKM
jgi:hypothetical protein